MIAILIAIIIISVIISRWSFFQYNKLPIPAIIIVLLLKSVAGYLSFKYHNIYFAGGDGAIYLQGGKDLIRFSGGNPIVFLKLFFNLNRGIPEWESIYTQLIYWDSKASMNFINDNRNAIRLNSIISLFSFNNLGLHIILLNFLSIIGLTALYKSFRMSFPSVMPLAVFVAVFLSPSILFWTSGILKETHTVFIVGFYLLYLTKLLARFSIKNGLLLLLFAFLLLHVRTYFAMIVFASTFFVLLLNFIQLQSNKKRIFILFSFIILLIITILTLAIEPLEILIQKQQDFILIGQKANSYFTISPLLNISDLFLHFPEAFINVFLQTQLLSFDSWLYIFPIIENLDVLIFIFIAIKYTKWPSKEAYAMLCGIFLIYVLSSWLIGLTVPIQGAIARYKSISQPFLLLFIFSFIDWDRLNKKYLRIPTD